MPEWLDYLFQRLKDKHAVTTEVDGQSYSIKADGTLGAPVLELGPQWIKPTLEVGSLGALVALYQAGLDDFEDDAALHVVNYRVVRLVRLKADEYGCRHVYAVATYQEETPFKFAQFQAPDKFLIDFRSSFYWNEEAVKVATLLSHLESGSSVTVADDGLSQKVEITQQTKSVTKIPVTLPADGVPLIPWRTFREAAPVESRFLLRLQAVKDSLPNAALFDIDQKWKLDTVASVAAWLAEKLPEATIVA